MATGQFSLVDFFNRWAGAKEGNCGLHPLIHTLLKFDLAQDVEKKEAEPRTPHFLRSIQDIVVRSQKQKCGLKYVMCGFWKVGWAKKGKSKLRSIFKNGQPPWGLNSVLPNMMLELVEYPWWV